MPQPLNFLYHDCTQIMEAFTKTCFKDLQHFVSYAMNMLVEDLIYKKR